MNMLDEFIKKMPQSGYSTPVETDKDKDEVIASLHARITVLESAVYELQSKVNELDGSVNSLWQSV